MAMQSVVMTDMYREHDSSNKSNEFERLAERLSQAVKACKRPDIACIDHSILQGMMEAYESNEEHWDKYAFGDPSRAYTRNLVDAGSGWSNLLVLVWSPGKASPIHDHTNSHCVMKVLKGRLCEIRYAWPAQSCATTAPATCPLEKTGQTDLSTNDVSYMSDTLGLHRMANLNPDDVAVSLHMYTPPNASKQGCYVFDQSTGKRSHVKNCNIYSAYGHQV